jgi:hypothetical protein
MKHSLNIERRLVAQSLCDRFSITIKSRSRSFETHLRIMMRQFVS